MESMNNWKLQKKEIRADQSPVRLNSLSDGVFAIVMTLLILEVKVPPMHEITSNQDLLNYLVALVPRIESFVFTFLVLGIFWMIHQLQFKYILQSDRNLVWINILFFMFVTFVPFSMHVAGAYGHLSAASLVFSINMLLVSLCLGANWRYATGERRLVDPNLSQQIIDFGIGRSNMLMITASLAILLSFFNSHLSFGAFLLYPVMQFFQKKS